MATIRSVWVKCVIPVNSNIMAMANLPVNDRLHFPCSRNLLSRNKREKLIKRITKGAIGN